MRVPVKICLLAIVVCLLFVDAECRRGEHHHKKRGKKHGHGHQRHSGEDTSNELGASSDKLKIHTVKIGWLNVPKVVGCRCRHAGAICIKGPDGKPTCVQKHHLKESARLFKHYHELKEKAEEDLNEVDPSPHQVLQDAPLRDPHHAQHDTAVPQVAPHDLHLSVVSRHHSDMSGSEQGPLHHSLGLKPKRGKDHLRLSHASKRTKENHLANTAVPQAQTAHCNNATLDEMRRRLTGWFHLLHSKDRHQHHGDHLHHHARRHLSVKKELREAGTEGQCRCLKSVMWEFHQLDTDRSHLLSKAEVKVIDNNDMEPCLHPYLLTCDRNRDGLLSHREWCCCFPQKESESPCYTRLDEIESTKNTEAYIPSCDGEGYYHKEQCMGGPSEQTCWCVTPTGSEISGSRTAGRAHCGKFDNMGNPQNKS